MSSASGTSLALDQDVWLLGKRYQAARRATDLDPAGAEAGEAVEGEPDAFRDLRDDWRSRIWVTYRKEFPELQSNVKGITSDAGWGCMIRTGQMMLAQALLQHANGRDWRWRSDDASSDAAQQHARILELFADTPKAVFSLHNLVYLGTSTVPGKVVGDWFGPGEIFKVMAALMAIHHGVGDVGIYHTDDQTIYRRDVEAMLPTAVSGTLGSASVAGADAVPTVAADSPSEADASAQASGHPHHHHHAVLVIVHAKYGSVRINAKHEDALLELFTWPEFIGIGGGKPRSSLYFIGTQGRNLLYLDPHTTQPAAPMPFDAASAARTYHCDVIRAIPVSDVDPSMALGFLVPSRDALDALCARIAAHHERFGNYAAVTVGTTKPAYHDLDERILDCGDDDDDVIVL